MVLSDEQRERIEKSRKKALAIRKRKLEEEKEKEEVGKEQTKKQKKVLKEGEEGSVELELFEEGASEYVTKQEAMKMYCLPLGTLQVCETVEKPNPRNGSWSNMKLYIRSEIRRRARKRFDGLEGLQVERQRRQEERYRKDLKKNSDVFR